MKEITLKNKPVLQGGPSQGFDPEMLYVECSRCGRPLIWEKGTTTFLLKHAGLDKSPGPDWMMMSKGCPSCSPGQNEFVLTLARPGKTPDRSLNVTVRFN